VGKIRAQYSLGFGDTEFNKNEKTFTDDTQAFAKGLNVHWIKPPSWMSSKEFDDLVIQNANTYHGPSYSIGGPNSNSAAALPIIASGGTVPEITGPWQLGAPALDHWLRNYHWGPF
jgi:hypothetical protein